MTEDAGEAVLEDVTVALVALEVKIADSMIQSPISRIFSIWNIRLDTTPSPRSQYLLKTSIADEL